MNDWDNLNNLPSDDDDNDDLSWLDGDDDDLDWLNNDTPSDASDSTSDDLSWQADDDDDFDLFADEADSDDFDLFADEADDAPDEWQMPRTDRAERTIASQMEDAEAADFGDTDEMLDWMASDSDDEFLDTEPPTEEPADAGGLDLPDWLSGMDLPEASDEEIAAVRAEASGSDTDADDDDMWGTNSFDDDSSADADDSGWGDVGFDDTDTDDIWGTSSTSDDNDTTSDNDGWGVAFETDDDNADSTDDDDLSWIGGDSAADADDDADDFAAFLSSDDDASADDDDDLSWLGSNSAADADDDADDFAAFLSSDDDTSADDDDDLSWLSGDSDDDDMLEGSADDFAAFMPDADENTADFDAFMPEATESTTDFDAFMPDAESDASDDADDFGWFDADDSSDDDTEDDADDGWGELVASSDEDDSDEEATPDTYDDGLDALFADDNADDDSESVPTPAWLADAESALPPDEDDEFDNLFASLDTGETYAVSEEDEEDEFDSLIASLDTGETLAIEDDNISNDALENLLADADTPAADSTDLADLLAELDTASDTADDNLDDLLSQLDTGTADGDDADLDDLLGLLGDDDTSPDSESLVIEDEELAELNRLSQMSTGDLDFMDGVTRASDDTETDEVDDELAEINRLNQMSTGDLDFMGDLDLEDDGSSRVDLDSIGATASTDDNDLDFLQDLGSAEEDEEETSDALPEAGEIDEELEELNRLSKTRTSELDFMDGVTRASDGTEADEVDEELEELNRLSKLDTSELDFMADVGSDDDFADVDEEFERLNELSKLDTGELEFMSGVERPEDDDLDDIQDLSDEEYRRIVSADAIQSGELDFLDDLDLEDEVGYKKQSFDSAEEEELDFLAELTGTPADADITQDEDDVDSQEDFLADFQTDEVDPDDDLFGDFDAPEEGETREGWFSEDFGSDNVITESEDDSAAVASIDDTPDWLDEISGINTDTLKDAARTTNEMRQVDVDALIDSFDDEDSDFNPAVASAANLNAVLAQLDEEQRSQLPDDLNADELPDWLREIATSTDADSAVAVIRERNDRSLDDLDDRLRNLHERGLQLTPQATQSEADKERLAKIVPNIDDVLTPAAVTPGQTTLVTDPALSPDQAERVALLQNLVGATVGADADTDATSTPQKAFQFVYARLDRVIIALMLLAAVLSPFVYPAFSTIGSLPPGEFATESPEFAAFTLIDNTESEDFVLIASEYGATGARELDTATRTFMEHIITNGGTPVIVSSNAIGILRAENIAVDLLGEESANEDFYVGGFLPAGTIGLRDFVLNASSVLATDVRGQATGLTLDSLEDFSAIVLISESGETVRNWMEQVAPSTDTNIVVVTGQAARPLALPYVSAVDNAVALLSGYDDAFTYQQMVLGEYNPSPTPAPTDTPAPTATPTEEPTATPTNELTATPEPTEAPTEETDAEEDEAESEANAAADDSNEDLDDTDDSEGADTADEETEDPTAIPTEEPTATATESPTDTPMPSPSPTPNTIIVAQVVATDTVNIRAGAGSNFALVGSAEPGEYLPLNNANTLQDDWINIQLQDGTEGWVASFLVEIVEIPDTELEAQRAQNETVRIGTIIGEGRVNVRSGPGEEFESVAGLDVNAEVRVLGESEDGAWVNVILPNETEGWVASFLIIIEERPASEWDGASRDGFFPIYFSRPQTVSQDDDADVPTVTIGTNVAGFDIPLYADVELTTEIGTVAALEQILILDELPDEEASFVQLETTAQGYVETRLLRIEEVPAETVDFVPTATPTPTLTPTATLTATPTLFAPQLTPAPPATDQTVRASSQAFGLIVAIAIIAFGNIFWVFRALRRGEA